MNNEKKSNCPECGGKGWHQALHGEDRLCETCTDQEPDEPDAATELSMIATGPFSRRKVQPTNQRGNRA